MTQTTNADLLLMNHLARLAHAESDIGDPASCPTPVTSHSKPRRHLVNAMCLSTPEEMQQHLSANLPGFGSVQWVKSTQSTNADLYALAREAQGHGLRPWVLGAHLQHAGRGRAGRSWQNRIGANLMFSCAYDIFLPPHLLPALSPLAGVLATEALRHVISPVKRSQLNLKWPNDIQWQGAKLAGLLVEVTRAGTARQSRDHHVAIIGLGINLEDARSLSQSLNRRVADWAQIARSDTLAATATATQLVSRIAMAWAQGLAQASSYGIDDLPARYSKCDALIGQAVQIWDAGRLRQTGVACGINTLGQLLLRTSAGETPVTVGDVSLRPYPNR